ncbi:MAG TPA: ubiquinol-cytochrome c reductase iron-sulfur subunit [Acetobacteraceae bacterium]|nr:ubiquinol-cytochrome c reductase iron-sulfur subunit [Acetobacteraceae bacterium]
MSSTTHPTPPLPGQGPGQKRRDFLTLVAGAGAAIGVGAITWPFIDSMEPAADTLAAGEPLDVDISKLAPGQQIVVVWRGKPIFIVNRSPEALKTLQDKSLLDVLSDPNSSVRQQPAYAENWHRSATPEIAVIVGVCTHLGCVPIYLPNPNATDPAPNWPGGYFCPCHGSKYDLAGRVYAGVPAPYNLPVPPYHMVNDKTVRIGENPPGQNFDLSSIVQI